MGFDFLGGRPGIFVLQDSIGLRTVFQRKGRFLIYESIVEFSLLLMFYGGKEIDFFFGFLHLFGSFIFLLCFIEDIEWQVQRLLNFIGIDDNLYCFILIFLDVLFHLFNKFLEVSYNNLLSSNNFNTFLCFLSFMQKKLKCYLFILVLMNTFNVHFPDFFQKERRVIYYF